MTELTKTLTVVAVAAALSLAASLIRPEAPGLPPHEEIGKTLFPDFKDPLDAKSLEILRFDEDLAEIRTFKVAQIGDYWVIPSHNSYPADAENKVRDAATILTDVEILNVATDMASEHEMFGVKEPDPDNIEAGDEGIGSLIVIQDGKGKNLARLVIGDEVKNSEDQRFVRRPSQDRVFVVKIDPDKISTKFEDWIKTDLLDINTWDIKEILIKDYSAPASFSLQGLGVKYDPRMQMRLTLENNSNWKLEELLAHDKRGGGLLPTEMLDDEELNTGRLNEMKNAFDDLEIVDVERKPKGLGVDLRAEEDFLDDKDNLQSLVKRGFYPVTMADTGQFELLCSDGEVLVRTDDGIEYVLRFGRVAGLEGSSDEADSLNRYLFVAVRLWEDKFPNAGQDEATEDEASKDEATEDEASKDEATEDEASKDEATEDEASKDEATEDEASKDEATEDEASKDEATEDEASKDEATEDEASKDEATEDEASKDEATEDADDKDKDSKDEAIAEQRERDEQDEKREKAEKKVKEMNDRFADWYYVISEDVFTKIHLGRSDVIKTSAESKEGFDVDTLRKLQEDAEKGEKEDPKTTT